MDDKKKLIALILICFSTLGFSQSDTSQVRELFRRGYALWSSYPDSMPFYMDKGMDLAKRLDDQIGLADVNSGYGVYYWVKGNYPEALTYFNASLTINRKLKRQDAIAKNLSNLGLIFSRMGEYPRAISYYLESIKMSEELGATNTTASTYNSLGVVYKNNRNYEEAINIFEKSLALFEENKDASSIAGIYTNMGIIFTNQNQLEKAIQYHQQALHIFDSLHVIRGLVTCYNNLSDALNKKGEYTEALSYRLKGLELSRKQGFPSGEMSALIGMAEINYKMGAIDKSINYYEEGLALARDKNYRNELLNIYQGIAQSLRAKKRYEEAFQFFDQYNSLKDSIFNQQALSSISNLRVAYELEKKEADIALLQKDKELATFIRNVIVTSSISLFIVLGLIVRFKMKKDKQEKELYKMQQDILTLDLQNRKLQEEELRNEIEYKNKSLTTYTLNLVQKNGMLEEVRECVQSILKNPGDQDNQLKKLTRLVDYSFTLDKDWDDFKLYFEQVHQGFFVILRERYPDLGGADLKLCALLRLNMNMKEAATILGISPDSVKMARHRLRKKFNLNTEENLTTFIMSI